MSVRRGFGVLSIILTPVRIWGHSYRCIASCIYTAEPLFLAVSHPGKILYHFPFPTISPLGWRPSLLGLCGVSMSTLVVPVVPVWVHWCWSKCKSSHTYWLFCHHLNCSMVSLTCTPLSATSSFVPQLSVCAVSHVLEVWLTHIFSPGGSAGQRGCHSHRAHGRGRCAAGVQGPEQEVC